MNPRNIFHHVRLIYLFVICGILVGCNKENSKTDTVLATFAGTIDINNLPNYANQKIPNYITQDNTTTNPITDKGATLGRVLFYDKNLSVNNTVSCATCHKQAFAFSDTNIASPGVNGLTARHSMRLINARFGEEVKFFWDKRAQTLEDQTKMPILAHVELGFSGENGDPSFQDLITKLSKITYYQELFNLAYGSSEITLIKIQNALAQFVRSIQSFDTKYDLGRAQVNNDSVDFPNFTALENLGKTLHLQDPILDNNDIRIGGGAGCQSCHRAPEFDIDPKSLSNGIGLSLSGGSDFSVFRSPTMRELVTTNGTVNTPFMHVANLKTLEAMLQHYNNLTMAALNNPNLDPALKPNGKGQQLKLSLTEISALVAFMKTLSGTDVYTNKKWSNPFL